MSTVPPPVADTRPDLDRRAYARAVRRVIVLLVAVGVAVRIARFLLPAAIWGDEAMLGMNILNRDYAGLTRHLDYAQVAPILFLWAEKFVIETAGMSEYAVRLLPLLAGLGGLLLFWDFARRVLPPTGAGFAVGLLAVSAWPVGMCVNLKPYSSDLFWSALLLALAARWHRRPERLWPLAGLAAVIPVAVGASYPVVFVAGAVSLYLLPLAWRGGRGAKFLYVAYNLALLAAFAAVYAQVGRAQDGGAGGTGEFMRQYWRAGFPPDSPVKLPVWLLERHTNRAFAYPIGDNYWGSTATTLLFITGIVWCWRNGSRPLLVVCLVPFALNLAAAFLGKYPYTGCCRLSQHLAPAVCLLAGAGIAAMLARLAPRLEDRLVLVRWGAGCLIVFATGALAARCYAPDRDPMCRAVHRLYQALDRACRPGDVVVVPADAEMDLHLQWYLRRLGDRVVRVGPGDPPSPAAGRVWVVVPNPGNPEADRHRRFVDAVRPAGYRAGHTTWYTVHPAPRKQEVWLSISVTCLSPPGDDGPPALNAVP